MKYRLVILAFVLSIATFLLSSTSASSRDTGAQGGCFPGTYLVVEGSGTQSLWTLSQDGGFQITSSAERAFGFSHIQGVWKKTGARDAKARGLDFNFKEIPVNGGVPPRRLCDRVQEPQQVQRAKAELTREFLNECLGPEGCPEFRGSGNSRGITYAAHCSIDPTSRISSFSVLT